jgi:hypothetical protein
MAVADGGELVVMAPGVHSFGEKEVIDKLIRRHGYVTTPELMAAIESDEELQQNLVAAAHLMLSSNEKRFTTTYCPPTGGPISREDIEGVHLQYGDLAEMLQRYDPGKLKPGHNTLEDGTCAPTRFDTLVYSMLAEFGLLHEMNWATRLTDGVRVSGGHRMSCCVWQGRRFFSSRSQQQDCGPRGTGSTQNLRAEALPAPWRQRSAARLARRSMSGGIVTENARLPSTPQSRVRVPARRARERQNHHFISSTHKRQSAT